MTFVVWEKILETNLTENSTKKTGHTPQICIRIRARNRGFLPLLLYLSKSLNDTGTTQWHSSFGKNIIRVVLWANGNVCVVLWANEKTRAHTHAHTKNCIRIRARNRGFLPLLFYLSKNLNDSGTSQWHSSFGKIRIVRFHCVLISKCLISMCSDRTRKKTTHTHTHPPKLHPDLGPKSWFPTFATLSL